MNVLSSLKTCRFVWTQAVMVRNTLRTQHTARDKEGRVDFSVPHCPLRGSSQGCNQAPQAMCQPPFYPRRPGLPTFHPSSGALCWSLEGCPSPHSLFFLVLPRPSLACTLCHVPALLHRWLKAGQRTESVQPRHCPWPLQDVLAQVAPYSVPEGPSLQGRGMSGDSPDLGASVGVRRLHGSVKTGRLGRDPSGWEQGPCLGGQHLILSLTAPPRSKTSSLVPVSR